MKPRIVLLFVVFCCCASLAFGQDGAAPTKEITPASAEDVKNAFKALQKNLEKFSKASAKQVEEKAEEEEKREASQTETLKAASEETTEAVALSREAILEEQRLSNKMLIIGFSIVVVAIVLVFWALWSKKTKKESAVPAVPVVPVVPVVPALKLPELRKDAEPREIEEYARLTGLSEFPLTVRLEKEGFEATGIVHKNESGEWMFYLPGTIGRILKRRREVLMDYYAMKKHFDSKLQEHHRK